MIRIDIHDPDEAADYVDALLTAAHTVATEDPARARRYKQHAHHLGDQLDTLPIPTSHRKEPST